jgi:uncharacterized protein
MNINLMEKPQNVTLIQGFPGFGMVGSISTEYLCDHLETREIGTILLPELFPIVAVHQGEIIPPLSIHYYEEGNIVIVKSLTKGKDYEWKFAEIISAIAKELKAKEIIALEGVNSPQESKKIYAYSDDKKKKEMLESKGFKPLREGIIMGVSAALLLKKPSCSVTCIFALTAGALPDSTAAAEIIKALDLYLGLKVAYDPLYEQAKIFEEKIQTILSKSQNALEEKEKNMVNYMG